MSKYMIKKEIKRIMSDNPVNAYTEIELFLRSEVFGSIEDEERAQELIDMYLLSNFPELV